MIQQTGKPPGTRDPARNPFAFSALLPGYMHCRAQKVSCELLMDLEHRARLYKAGKIRSPPLIVCLSGNIEKSSP